MLFSSISFLYLFLPVLIVYYLVPNSWRNHVLLIASLFFYFVYDAFSARAYLQVSSYSCCTLCSSLSMPALSRRVGI